MMLILLLCCLFFSCASQTEAASGGVPLSGGNEKYVFDVRVSNDTLFDIEVIDDSRIIPHGQERTVSLPVFSSALNDGYQIWYHVNLLDDILIKLRRQENIIIPGNQHNATVNSPDFVSQDVYLIVENNTNQVISLKSGTGSANYLNYLVRLDPEKQYGSSVYIEHNKRQLYEIPSGADTLVVETDQYKTVPFPSFVYRPGHIYSFSFDGASARLTDARPLRSIGEKGWVKNLDEAGDIPCLASDDGGNIAVFASADDGIRQYSLTAANGTGLNKAAATDDSGEPIFVYALIPRDNDDFLAAGSAGLDDNCLPRMWKKTGGGLVNIPFTVSYHNAALFALARDDTNGLVAAGSALKNGVIGDYTAYIQAFREEGNRAGVIWELGPDNLEARYGEIRSVMYDAKNKVWRAVGKLLEYDRMGNPAPGSFLMEINAEGKIIKTPFVFRGFSFYAIRGAKDGAYFLIGEEEKGAESVALVQKYDENGTLLWRQKTQLPSFSYYYDAVLDEDNAHIVLAGTMRARDAAGTDGVPFIQGIDAVTGSETWRSELTDPVCAGANLAGALVKLPDYGYAAALCGIRDGGSEKPYVIVRVNERGLLLK